MNIGDMLYIVLKIGDVSTMNIIDMGSTCTMHRFIGYYGRWYGYYGRWYGWHLSVIRPVTRWSVQIRLVSAKKSAVKWVSQVVGDSTDRWSDL
jgi:hypothetical protein